MKKLYNIKFPAEVPYTLSQDEAYFILTEDNNTYKIRFHDYVELFKRPGLYEQLFYLRLKCMSPQKVTEILEKAVKQSGDTFSELRILDIGAGNGMMGFELSKHGIARMIGVDILKEAADAAIRDYPGIYDDYYVINLANLDTQTKEIMDTWQINCLTSVAAIGFDDIPPKAFANGYNLISSGGWVAFNIKDSFFENKDESPFSKLIKEIIFDDYFEIYHLEKYRHRISIDGKSLFYFALVGKKIDNIPEALLSKL